MENSLDETTHCAETFVNCHDPPIMEGSACVSKVHPLLVAFAFTCILSFLTIALALFEAPPERTQSRLQTADRWSSRAYLLFASPRAILRRSGLPMTFLPSPKISHISDQAVSVSLPSLVYTTRISQSLTPFMTLLTSTKLIPPFPIVVN